VLLPPMIASCSYKYICSDSELGLRRIRPREGQLDRRYAQGVESVKMVILVCSLETNTGGWKEVVVSTVHLSSRPLFL
jgi:hypothetical protein